MTYTSFPFENQDTTETQYSYLFRLLQESGVVGDVNGPALKVSATTGLAVSIATGRFYARGFVLDVTAAETLTLAAAESNPRIDRVVARVNPAGDAITLAVLKGTAATAPAPTALTQSETAVFEVSLAAITVAPGTTTLTAAMIADERRFVGGRAGRWAGDAARPPAPVKWDRGMNESRGYVEAWNGSAWVPEPVSPVGLTAALTAAQIPALDATKITTGTLDAARIPNIDAAKITTGTLAAARIPTGLSGAAVSLAATTGSAVIAGSPVTLTERGDTANAVIVSGGTVAIPRAYSTAANVGTPRDLQVCPNGLLGYVSSTRAHKTDIEPLTATPVLDLEPVTYLRIADSSLPRETGVIAEQAVDVGLDDLVWTDEDGEVAGFDYKRLSVHLLAALRTHEKRLADLESAAA